MSLLQPPSVATQIYLRKIITRAQSFQYQVIHDWSHNRVTYTGANNMLGQLYKIIFDAVKHYEYLAHKNDIIIQQRPSRQQKHSFDKMSINGKHSSHLLKGMIYASLTLLQESTPTTYQPVI
jgi:hypothetical protein